MQKTKPTKESIVDTVADLRVGDEITIEGRAKPLTVQRVKARTVETRDGDRLTQHAVEVEGDWEGANTFVLADAVNPLVGEHTGEVKFFGDRPRDVPEGFAVRRVGGGE